jgi:hypothetical protein
LPFFFPAVALSRPLRCFLLDDNHLNEVLTIRYSSSDLNLKRCPGCCCCCSAPSRDNEFIRRSSSPPLLDTSSPSRLRLLRLSSNSCRDIVWYKQQCKQQCKLENSVLCPPPPSREGPVLRTFPGYEDESRILLQDRRPYLENLSGFEVPVRRSLCWVEAP